MPFPVAHSLIGAGVAAALDKNSEGRWRVLCLSALLAIAPDFDYALNWLHVGRGGWHHGFTHSIVFALFAGALTAFVCGWRSVQGFVVFSGAIVSHTLLDYLMTESQEWHCGGPSPIGDINSEERIRLNTLSAVHPSGT